MKPAMNTPRPADFRRIVVKVGSSLLVDAKGGRLNEKWLASLASDIAALHAGKRDILVVSSGAIALGRAVLKLAAGELALEDSQGAAAVGQIALARTWTEALSRHGITAGQVLVTLGISFIIADICLLVWTGDPMPLAAPAPLRAPLRIAGYAFPTYRLVVLAIALIAALALYLLMERTRLGAMIRAGVDDMEMARGVGIPVSRLFTTVFLLGATLAGLGGVLGGPILNAYPGLDTDMLPLALIVVILGGAGSLLGAFVGSFIVGFIYNFGIALVPDLAYFVLFLPMVLVLVFLPQGLFGRVQI